MNDCNASVGWSSRGPRIGCDFLFKQEEGPFLCKLIKALPDRVLGLRCSRDDGNVLRREGAPATRHAEYAPKKAYKISKPDSDGEEEASHVPSIQSLSSVPF